MGVDGRGFPNVGMLSLQELSYDGVNVGNMNLMFTPDLRARMNASDVACKQALFLRPCNR
jgi:hypothetical protein